jgi:uncharacterized protein YjbJ (UPF0337 family)
MNWDQIAGQWKQFAGRAREKWGLLTESEIEATKGRRDQLEGIIQERYGISKEEAHRQLEEWMAAQQVKEKTRTSGLF